MKKRLQRWFMKDLQWKLFSVVLASVLWFMVINIEHPVDTRTYFQTVKVQREASLAEAGLTILNRSEIEDVRVAVKVKSQRTALDRLSQFKNNIQATVDLEKAVTAKKGDTVSMAVDIKLPEIVGKDFELISISPATIDLHMDDLAAESMPVSAGLSGGAAEGYIMQTPSVSPKEVVVSGPSTLVDQVASIRAAVDAKSLRESTMLSAVPIPYAKDGSVIEGVYFNVAKVQVSLRVSRTKRVPVEAITSGALADGYFLNGLTPSVSFLDVTGEEEALDALTQITIPPLSLTGRTQTFSQSFLTQELLPEGIHLVADTPLRIQVTAAVEEEGSLTLVVTPTAQKHSATGVSYDISSVSVHLKGRQATLRQLAPSDLKATIDPEGLTDGEYHLPVTLTLPEGVRLAGDTVLAAVSITSEGTTEPVGGPDAVMPEDAAAESDEES